jgi:hypothetical protein
MFLNRKNRTMDNVQNWVTTWRRHVTLKIYDGYVVCDISYGHISIGFRNKKYTYIYFILIFLVLLHYHLPFSSSGKKIKCSRRLHDNERRRHLTWLEPMHLAAELTNLQVLHLSTAIINFKIDYVTDRRTSWIISLAILLIIVIHFIHI